MFPSEAREERLAAIAAEKKREWEEAEKAVRAATREVMAEKQLMSWFPEPKRNGATVVFSKWFQGSKEYFYAARKSPAGWSVTGRTTMNGISWKSVLHFIYNEEADKKRAMESLRWVQKTIPGNSNRSTIVRKTAEEAEAEATRAYVAQGGIGGEFGYSDIINGYDEGKY